MWEGAAPGLDDDVRRLVRIGVIHASPVAIGPTSDSLRTSVGGMTRSLVMVIFAPASYSGGRLA